MKKLVSILMVAVMVLSLAACGTNDKEEAEKTLNGFMEAFREFDSEAMKEYVDDESVVPDFEELMEREVDNVMGRLPAAFDDYEEDFKEMVTDFVERTKDTLSYEIKEVKEDEGKYIFTVKLAMADTASLDFEKEFEEKISEEELKQLIQDEYLAGNLTDSSTNKEVYKVIMPKLLTALEEVFEEAELEEDTTEEELVVIEQDGKWVIDSEASDL